MNLRTSRWKGGIAASLILIGVGILARSPPLFVAASIPVVFLVYSSLTTIGEIDLDIERLISPSNPSPGERVTINLRITNTGQHSIPDLRVIDKVPQTLSVIAGSPRICTALPPGGETRFEYTVRARRGDHRFDAPVIIGRNLAGSRAKFMDTGVNKGSHTRISCKVSLENAPISEPTLPYTGELPTDSGGEGIEFHSTRNYQLGDSTNRIDWRRYAKTGTLTVVDYQKPRAADVIIVIDTRDDSLIQGGPGLLTGMELAGYAATRLFSAITEAGHWCGIASIRTTLRESWLKPSSSPTHEAEAKQVIESLVNGESITKGKDKHFSDSSPFSEGFTYGKELCEWMPTEAHVFLITPLLDDVPVTATRTLTAYGHQVTVLSPTLTGPIENRNETVGYKLEGVRRDLRVGLLRGHGITVIDWDPDELLPASLSVGLSKGEMTDG